MSAKLEESALPIIEATSPSDLSRLYESDFYTWTRLQSAALREGGEAALDRDHLAEEIADLGNELVWKLRSSYRIILMHMLKWDHQPERRSRSWALSIATHRIDIQDVVKRNPGLKSRRIEAFTSAYRVARLDAAKETDLPASRFPKELPYTLEDAMGRPFSHGDE